MWMWCRDATKRYWGPDATGVYFNTACFQQAVRKTTGQMPDEQTAKMWLGTYGKFYYGHGGCHWFKDMARADATYQKDQIKE